MSFSNIVMTVLEETSGQTAQATIEIVGVGDRDYNTDSFPTTHSQSNQSSDISVLPRFS